MTKEYKNSESDVEEITKEEAETFPASSDPVNPTVAVSMDAANKDSKEDNNRAASKSSESYTQKSTEFIGVEIVESHGDRSKDKNVKSLQGDVPTSEDKVHDKMLSKGEAIQIVSIGNESDKYAFKYHADAFRTIMQKISDPLHTKISVVSVVGAFRTGKSFLLSWFLRYLDFHFGSSIPELDYEDSNEKKWFETFETLGNEGGFQWRGGQERNTTGIWMWSEPFLVTKSSSKERFALLLVDTQGMFDHETTMSLTAAIFGLSTLLSSYQIYNVDKRIQEDHLQQLALFSEYGRIALKVEQDEAKAAADLVVQTKVTEPKSESAHTRKEITIAKKNTEMVPRKPFQKIEFLVRDWQNFDDDEVTEENVDEIIQSMEKYLSSVLEERDAKDLKDTREQISTCFEIISCFLLPHPGFAVTKKKYTGDVKSIESMFLQLLDRYCRRVFDVDTLQAKIINGRELTAAELEAYMKAYAGLFEEGAHFPETGTMLEATATANNSNAIALSIANYRTEMDHLAGTNITHYVKPEEFEEEHLKLLHRSLRVFDEIAGFGSLSSIQSARERVLNEIDSSFRIYQQLNESRNPLMGFEIYIIPMTIALLAFLLRWIADTTCSSWSHTCRHTSHFLAEAYTVVFLFILIIAATKAKLIRERYAQLKAAFF